MPEFFRPEPISIATEEPLLMNPLPSTSRFTWQVEPMNPENRPSNKHQDHEAIVASLVRSVASTNAVHGEFQELWAEMLGDLRALALGECETQLDLSKGFSLDLSLPQFSAS